MLLTDFRSKLTWANKKSTSLCKSYSTNYVLLDYSALVLTLNLRLRCKSLLNFLFCADKLFMLKAPQDPTETIFSNLIRLFFKLVRFFYRFYFTISTSYQYLQFVTARDFIFILFLPRMQRQACN